MKCLLCEKYRQRATQRCLCVWLRGSYRGRKDSLWYFSTYMYVTASDHGVLLKLSVMVESNRAAQEKTNTNEEREGATHNGNEKQNQERDKRKRDSVFTSYLLTSPLILLLLLFFTHLPRGSYDPSLSLQYYYMYVCVAPCDP